MQYTHTGVPTTQEKNWAGYVPELGVHYVDPSTDPYGIELLKFDADSPVDEAIRTRPHVAFRVDNLNAALEGKKVLLAPMSPLPGLLLAYIDYEGVIIELSQMASDS